MSIAQSDQAPTTCLSHELRMRWIAERSTSAMRAAALLVALASTAVKGSLFAEGAVTSLAEREVRRREALVRNSVPRLHEADALLKTGKTEEAVRVFSDVYRSLPKAGMAEEVRTAARAGFAAASCLRARELMAEARYAEADELLANVLSADVDPDNAEAKKLRAQFADPDRYPRALTPQHIANAKEVLRLLELANSAVEIGDYDKANATYESVLRLDPYNKSARRGMERLERFRSEYFDAARDHTRAKMLGHVDALWEQDVPPTADDVSSRFSPTGGMTNVRGGREEIIAKMRETIVPKVEFNGSTLDEVIEYLRVRSRDLDPKGRGVDFVLNLPPDTASRPINLYLEQVPLDEVVRYVTEKAGAIFRVEDRAVMIHSISEHSTQLIPKTYRVPPNFIQTSLVGDAGGAAAAPAADPFAAQQPAAGGGGLQVKRMGAKEFLESRGVTFKEGATASYIAATNSLIVRNTPENLAIVDQLVEQVAEMSPKQVLVSVRLLEVDQKNFEEFRQDIGLGMANVPGSDRVFASGGSATSAASGLPGVFSTTSGLRTSGDILGRPGIDSLITNRVTPAIDSASPTAFQLLGVFTDPQFQVALTALSQKKGMDLLSVPSVITKSGVTTEIEMVREFPYPTEFDPPQIPQNIDYQGNLTLVGGNGPNTSFAGTAPVTPTTPTAFETRKVGSLLEVETVVSPDGRQVELTLSPSTTEFEGFINYGSDIRNTSFFSSFDPVNFAFNNTHADYIQPNPIIQPVFRTNKLKTGVLIWDGSTIVVGGVISEKKQQITDKVPLLGDLPVIGKLWQNKVTQVEKKNVLFFVTVKVIDAAGQPIRQPVTTAQSQAQ